MIHSLHGIKELDDLHLIGRCIPTNEELEIPLLRLFERVDQLK